MSPSARVVTNARTLAGASQSGITNSASMPELFDEFCHVIGQRHAPIHEFSAARMLKLQRGRVRRLARKYDARARAAAIDDVPYDRMPDVLQMHADLVRAAG